VRLDRCEFEESVLRALRLGQSSGDLQAHLDQCEVCREVQLVADFLYVLERAQVSDVPLPSPESLWWRGQIAQKRDLAERSVAAISVVQRIAGVLIVGLLGVLAVLWAHQLFGGSPRMAHLSVAAILLLASSATVLYAWARERI
jgi:predicted anti-sigma-YlaC factor YlaD